MREDDLVTVIDSLNDAVFLHDLDGNMLFVNEATCVRLGYSEAELLDMRPRDFVAPGPQESSNTNAYPV